ncbi:MAG: magnesium and cobalt transport protein CorA [Candidatus Heimdallarchaeota archaeon]|nr:magnesium and cobalt transport protein CorA [Candidatus Heimdallarchaeota archaeon]
MSNITNSKNDSIKNTEDSPVEIPITQINFICYDEKNFEEFKIENVNTLKDLFKEKQVNWVDIVGTKNLDIIKSIGENFNIHPLIVEDIYSTDQRLKIDYFPDYAFIVVKAVNYIKGEIFELEQINIIFGKNFVFSFQEFLPNQFEQIFERIKQAKGRVRKFGADYLVYVLLDILVDNYFTIMEDFSERIDELQEILIDNPSPKVLQEIYELKKDLIKIRKAAWPLREVVSQISKIGAEFFNESTNIYFRDVYDHVIQIIDTLETYRDMLSGMVDIFMSSVSNKMNEIMKVLTIIATIFIPLTFIAGVYGMNFQFMPELAWKWGYLTIMCLMIVIGIGMIVFFRRKKWL